MTVTVQYAAEHLEELLDAMDGGDSIEVVRADQRVTRLNGETKQVPVGEGKAQRVLGAGEADQTIRHLIDNWDDIDREWKRSFEDKFSADAA